MTEQVLEILIYNGKEEEMFTTPLDNYFEVTNQKTDFRVECTACWRGYLGTWEIVNNHLFMKAINAKFEDGSEVTLRTIFPNRIGRIFADWFSGELHVPRGKVIYEDDNYQPVYKEELILEVTNGLVTKEIIIKNGSKGDIKRSEKILASKIMLPLSDPPEVFRTSPEESDDANSL